MSLPSVGTIVRVWDQQREDIWLAVVVPIERMKTFWVDDLSEVRATIPLTNPGGCGPNSIKSHDGWIIGQDGAQFWDYEVIPDDEVTDDILALAGRVLLDPNFIPFVKED